MGATGYMKWWGLRDEHWLGLQFQKGKRRWCFLTRAPVTAVHRTTRLTFSSSIILWGEWYWIEFCLKGQHSWLLHAHAYASGFLPLLPSHPNPLPNKTGWQGLSVWISECLQWHQTRGLKTVESSLPTRLAAHGWTKLIHNSEGKNVGFDWMLKASAAIPEENDLLFCFREHKEQVEFFIA